MKSFGNNIKNVSVTTTLFSLIIIKLYSNYKYVYLNKSYTVILILYPLLISDKPTSS